MSGLESNQPLKDRLRKRIGRIIIYVGIILFVSILTLELGVMLVYAYNGSSSLISITNDVAFLAIPLSFILILIGLIMVLMPDGISSDTIWVLKTGPYIR